MLQRSNMQNVLDNRGTVLLFHWSCPMEESWAAIRSGFQAKLFLSFGKEQKTQPLPRRTYCQFWAFWSSSKKNEELSNFWDLRRLWINITAALNKTPTEVRYPKNNGAQGSTPESNQAKLNKNRSSSKSKELRNKESVASSVSHLAQKTRFIPPSSWVWQLFGSFESQASNFGAAGGGSWTEKLTWPPTSA